MSIYHDNDESMDNMLDDEMERRLAHDDGDIDFDQPDDLDRFLAEQDDPEQDDDSDDSDDSDSDDSDDSDSDVDVQLIELTPENMDKMMKMMAEMFGGPQLSPEEQAKKDADQAKVDAYFDEHNWSIDDTPIQSQMLLIGELNEKMEQFPNDVVTLAVKDCREGNYDDVFGDESWEVGLTFLRGRCILSYGNINRPQAIVMVFVESENARKFFEFGKWSWSVLDGNPLSLAGA